MSKLSLDLSAVTTVAVDLAKHVFQVHGCDGEGRVVIAKGCGARMCCPSLRHSGHALSAWKPAGLRIIGGGS